MYSVEGSKLTDAAKYVAPSAALGATTYGLYHGKCATGYICLEGASASKPTDGTTGFICPLGHYCDGSDYGGAAVPK
jgi:hypothetical protein